MDVTLPNGAVIRGVPEGTPKDQIKAKAIAAGLATDADFGPVKTGNTAGQDISVSPFSGATGMASQYGFNQGRYDADKQALEKRLSALPEGQADVIREMTPVQRTLANIGAGFTDIYYGVPGTGENPNLDISKQLTEATDGGLARAIGQAAPFAPAAVAMGGFTAGGLAGSMGRQALVGGLEGATIASGTGGDAGEIVEGGLVGAGIGAGAEVIGAGINRLAIPLVRKHFGNSANPFDAAGNPTPELTESLAQEGASFDDLIRASEEVEKATVLTPERAARNEQRQQAFERFGITPTEAQRTRDKDLYMQQQDRYKQGGIVTDTLERQEQQLSNAVTGAVQETGGDAINAVTSPIEVITNRSLRADQEINDLYRAARESAPTEKAVRFNNAARILRQYAPDNELSGGVIASLRGTMEQSGALSGFNPSGRISVESVEKIRQKANQIFNSTNDQGRAIIRQFKDALDQDVGEAVGEDWFRQARAAKARFESGLDREKFHKFDERNVNIVRDILNNKLTPDQIEKGALVNAGSKYKAQDLVELRRYLSSGSAEDIAQGQQAWNDIRASAMQQIKDVAFTGPSTEIGTQQLSRAGIEKALKQIGRQKFNVLFTPREQIFLFDLAEVARYKEPPSGTFTGSGPSGPAIQQLENRITTIYGIQLPILSSIKGRLTDQKLLRLNDDLAQLERERFIELLRPYRTAIVGGASSTTVSASQKEDNQQ